MNSHSLFASRLDRDPLDDCFTMVELTIQRVTIFEGRLTDLARLTRSRSVQTQSQWLPRPDARGRPGDASCGTTQPCARIRNPRFLHIFVIRTPATGRYVNRCHRSPHMMFNSGRSTPPSPHVVTCHTIVISL